MLAHSAVEACWSRTLHESRCAAATGGCAKTVTAACQQYAVTARAFKHACAAAVASRTLHARVRCIAAASSNSAMHAAMAATFERHLTATAQHSTALVQVDTTGGLHVQHAFNETADVSNGALSAMDCGAGNGHTGADPGHVEQDSQHGGSAGVPATTGAKHARSSTTGHAAKDAMHALATISALRAPAAPQRAAAHSTRKPGANKRPSQRSTTPKRSQDASAGTHRPRLPRARAITSLHVDSALDAFSSPTARGPQAPAQEPSPPLATSARDNGHKEQVQVLDFAVADLAGRLHDLPGMLRTRAATTVAPSGHVRGVLDPVEAWNPRRHRVRSEVPQGGAGPHQLRTPAVLVEQPQAPPSAWEASGEGLELARVTTFTSEQVSDDEE